MRPAKVQGQTELSMSIFQHDPQGSLSPTWSWWVHLGVPTSMCRRASESVGECRSDWTKSVTRGAVVTDPRIGRFEVDARGSWRRWLSGDGAIENFYRLYNPRTNPELFFGFGWVKTVTGARPPAAKLCLASWQLSLASN